MNLVVKWKRVWKFHVTSINIYGCFIYVFMWRRIECLQLCVLEFSVESCLKSMTCKVTSADSAPFIVKNIKRHYLYIWMDRYIWMDTCIHLNSRSMLRETFVNKTIDFFQRCETHFSLLTSNKQQLKLLKNVSFSL